MHNVDLFDSVFHVGVDIRHLPERSFFFERVIYGHLDHFLLVAWRLALHSVLVRDSTEAASL